MKNIMLMLAGGLAGAIIGVAGYHAVYLQTDGEALANTESAPLYWVAPMDPNYRRDKPGKSPMGMDLVPVYEENHAADSPGTITISPEVENNLGVRTATAKRKPIAMHIDTVGYIQFNEDDIVHVHPRVEGWLERLYIKTEGEQVEQGMPLFSIYSPALVSAQEELLLALARNNRKLLRSAKERLRALQLSDEQIKTLLKQKKVMREITVFSPKSGVITNLGVREGEYVKPSNTLFSVAPLDEVWVIADIFERQLSQVNIGDLASMRVESLPQKTWQGVVDYIYPTLDPTSRTARARLRIDNQEGHLLPNMFAHVAIHSEAPTAQWVVPREAVIRTGKQNRVVVALGEGKYKSVAVSLGLMTDDEVEILSGLHERDVVVISAQFLIDSESSISSDFLRMTPVKPVMDTSIWAEGTVVSQEVNTRVVTVDHKAVEAWGWPNMVMDFEVADDVDLHALTPDTVMHFEITKVDQHYLITGTHIIQAGKYSDIDHSQHEGMDHSQHKGMDYSQHEGMDHSQHEGMDHSMHKEHGGEQ